MKSTILTALRIIVRSNEECYRALAVSFMMLFARFLGDLKISWAARSLIVTVVAYWGVGLTRRPFKVQIGTMEIHHIAE